MKYLCLVYVEEKEKDAWIGEALAYDEELRQSGHFTAAQALQSVQTATEWNNSRLIKGNVAEEVARLKQQPSKNISITGSGELVRSLMQYDLIDEYRLLVCPVVLGTGKRLFRDGSDMKVLRLVETKPYSSGMVVLSYQPAGKEVKK